ncbi:hypothetical protein [Thermocrinis albus]|uniref:hypothetical protein n=1 Tax=Thermocrinis albus TaxID=136094 RepID=UPI0011D13C47|nr:hypothetical protein [Thermocrinis albus]
MIKGVNFPSYVFASLVAGYVMMGVDIMLEGFLGLFGSYRQYVEIVSYTGLFRGYEDLAMVIGHTFNSMIFAIFFVTPQVYHRLPSPWGAVKGLFFGICWHALALAFLVITSLLGARMSELMLPHHLHQHLTLLLLHVVWGVTLGALYNLKDDNDSYTRESKT